MFAAPILRQPISQQLHACLRWSPWSGVEGKQVSYNYCCRPSFSSLPSLACNCLPPSSGEQCGKASLVPVYIADPPRHLSPTFSICAPGLLLASISASAEEEISNQTTIFFCAPQKSSPSFRLVRANDVLFVLAIPFALSLFGL